MATTFLGAGACSAGDCAAGYGEPATADAPSKQVVGACRYINPGTRDFVLNDDGTLDQMTSAQQLVYVKVANITTWPDRIADDFERTVQSILETALVALTKPGLITILTINVTRKGLPFATLRWRDNSTGEEYTIGV